MNNFEMLKNQNIEEKQKWLCGFANRIVLACKDGDRKKIFDSFLNGDFVRDWLESEIAE